MDGEEDVTSAILALESELQSLTQQLEEEGEEVRV